jgi:hypothetical protein
MHQLLGQDYAPARDRLPENAVLVARSMGRRRCSTTTAAGCAG